MQNLLSNPRFPRSLSYNSEWIIESVSGGANSLWLTEWLSEVVDLKPGMRILDIGCGRAASSVFLCREFKVQVWAVDKTISVSENYQRIFDAGMSEFVFPLNGDANNLPFADNFFDAIISIDSYFYYGTDDLYLNYILRFLKPNGVIAIAGAGLMQEINGTLPPHLHRWWTSDLWCLHSAPWWKRHWERTGFVDVLTSDTMENGWKFWLDWHRTVAADNYVEIEALIADHGNYLGYTRTVAKKRTDTNLGEQITQIPYTYTAVHLISE